MIITFHVTGEPKGQPRPKAFARNMGGGKFMARVYDPGTAENWKSLIAFAAKGHTPAIPLEGPLRFVALFCLPRPKSHFRSNRLLKLGAPKYHEGRGDVDNFAKAAMDALTQIGMWKDDGQVAVLEVQKFYGNQPGADFTIETLLISAGNAENDPKLDNRAGAPAESKLEGGA